LKSLAVTTQTFLASQQRLQHEALLLHTSLNKISNLLPPPNFNDRLAMWQLIAMPAVHLHWTAIAYLRYRMKMHSSVSVVSA